MDKVYYVIFKEQSCMVNHIDPEEYTNDYISKIETAFKQGLEKGDFSEFCSFCEEIGAPLESFYERPILRDLEKGYYLFNPSLFGYFFINKDRVYCHYIHGELHFSAPAWRCLDSDVGENFEEFENCINYISIKYLKDAKVFTSYENLKVYVGTLPLACPKQGEIIGYKVVDIIKEYYPIPDEKPIRIYKKAICKLRIPADGRRISAHGGNKCRCDKAEVLAIYDKENEYTKGKSAFYYACLGPTTYKVGKWIYADEFNPSPWVECSHGIHFFLTEEEAMELL